MTAYVVRRWGMCLALLLLTATQTFDLVIFQNFDYRPYRALDIERTLPGLRDYVRGGGAFAMVGGEQSFGEARYGSTALQEILPVEAVEGLGTVAEEVRPRLTADGRRHPVTSLVRPARGPTTPPGAPCLPSPA